VNSNLHFRGLGDTDLQHKTPHILPISRIYKVHAERGSNSILRIIIYNVHAFVEEMKKS